MAKEEWRVVEEGAEGKFDGEDDDDDFDDDD